LYYLHSTQRVHQTGWTFAFCTNEMRRACYIYVLIFAPRGHFTCIRFTCRVIYVKRTAAYRFGRCCHFQVALISYIVIHLLERGNSAFIIFLVHMMSERKCLMDVFKVSSPWDLILDCDTWHFSTSVKVNKNQPGD
jgi:hypothetical protein